MSSSRVPAIGLSCACLCTCTIVWLSLTWVPVYWRANRSATEIADTARHLLQTEHRPPESARAFCLAVAAVDGYGTDGLTAVTTINITAPESNGPPSRYHVDVKIAVRLPSGILGHVLPPMPLWMSTSAFALVPRGGQE